MNRILLYPLFILAAIVGILSHGAEPLQPNVVLILADDMGVGDVSCLNPHSAWKTPHVDGVDALQLEPASIRLHAFTSGQKRPGRSWLSLESLLRDEMPPLEDLIIGGQPGPIGGT